MAISLIVASSDEHFREMVRENLLNIAGAKVISEYPEVSPNLYIRVLQDLDRHSDAALVIDMSADSEGALKALEKVRQAAPGLYVVVANYHADGETVIAALRSGASDFLLQPLKRVEFRDAMNRLEHAPRHTTQAPSRLGKVYTFVGTKGGVGTTTLAVNFAAVLAQRKQHVVLLDLDWAANDVAMQVGAQPQYTLAEIGDNLSRMDQALFEGFVTRDPVGFFLVGPPDSLDQHRSYFTEPMFREFAAFLVEKYETVVIDAGRLPNDELAVAALQASSTIFLVLSQEFAAVRNAQRYIGYLMRLGFNQDQIKLVVNEYQKRTSANFATLEQIQQTLNQPVFFGIPTAPIVPASINRARPFVTNREAAGDMDRIFRAFVTKVAGGDKAAAAKTA